MMINEKMNTAGMLAPRIGLKICKLHDIGDTYILDIHSLSAS